MANFNIPYSIGVQAAKDAQVQYQNDRTHGMMPRNAEMQPEDVKNVSRPKPKGNIKQMIGTVAGIAGAIALGVILHLLDVI